MGCVYMVFTWGCAHMGCVQMVCVHLGVCEHMGVCACGLCAHAGV